MNNNTKNQRIVKQCEESGEPYIVFRAKDIFSPMVISYYSKLITEHGPVDPEFKGAVDEKFEEFHTWQHENVTEVKYPD